MRALIVAELNSAHTSRWANALVRRGMSVTVVGLRALEPSLFSYDQKVRVVSLAVGKCERLFGARIPTAVRIATAVGRLRKAISEEKPDIIHSHYATSYGLLNALVDFHPSLLSVWGSDVYDFPRKSPVHREYLRWVLRRPDAITSTSFAMKREVRRYTRRPVDVIGFGIDVQAFSPAEDTSPTRRNRTVVGTVKALESTYGIDILISAFARVARRSRERSLRLLIVGRGPDEKHLRRLCDNLGIADRVDFTGYVPNHQVADYHRMIDIFVAVSRRESFGVSVVEACACGKPVVVSAVGGLVEIVKNGVSGIVVPPESVNDTERAIGTLLENRPLREEMGRAGRQTVLDRYDLQKNVIELTGIYSRLVSGLRSRTGT